MKETLQPGHGHCKDYGPGHRRADLGGGQDSYGKDWQRKCLAVPASSESSSKLLKNLNQGIALNTQLENVHLDSCNPLFDFADFCPFVVILSAS